jgi:hypothetical protein
MLIAKGIETVIYNILDYYVNELRRRQAVCVRDQLYFPALLSPYFVVVGNIHCPPKLSHKVKMNRSFLYFTSSTISLCVNLLFYRISFV